MKKTGVPVLIVLSLLLSIGTGNAWAQDVGNTVASPAATEKSKCQDEISRANDLAAASFAKNDCAGAVTHLRQAITGLQKEDPQSYWLGMVWKNLEFVAKKQADTTTAAEAAKNADAIFSKLHFTVQGQGKTLEPIPGSQKARKAGQQLIAQIHMPGQPSAGDSESTGDQVVWLMCMNLGQAAKQSGQLNQAENFLKRAVQEAEAFPQDRDKNVAASTGALAAVYSYKGEYAEAERVYHQAEELIKKAYGENSRDYATVLDNEAVFYYKIKNYDKADELRTRALAVYEKNGPSMDLAIAYSNMGGGVLEKHDQSQLPKAEEYLTKAVEMYKKLVPADDPRVAVAKDMLGIIYLKQNKFEQAETIQKEALASFEKYYGPNSLDTAATLTNLTSTCFKRGKHEDAKKYMGRYVTIMTHVYGPDAPQTKAAMQRFSLLQNAIK